MASPQTNTADLDAWLAEHLLGWMNLREHSVWWSGCRPNERRWLPVPKLSTTGDGMLMLMNCDPPEPWALRWRIQQFREGYYGPWWVGCSVTPGWSSFTHPYEWARHADLPMAAAVVLRQTWENKCEHITPEERAAIEERNAPTPETGAER